MYITALWLHKRWRKSRRIPAQLQCRLPHFTIARWRIPRFSKSRPIAKSIANSCRCQCEGQRVAASISGPIPGQLRGRWRERPECRRGSNLAGKNGYSPSSSELFGRPDGSTISGHNKVSSSRTFCAEDQEDQAQTIACSIISSTNIGDSQADKCGNGNYSFGMCSSGKAQGRFGIVRGSTSIGLHPHCGREGGQGECVVRQQQQQAVRADRLRSADTQLRDGSPSSKGQSWGLHRVLGIIGSFAQGGWQCKRGKCGHATAGISRCHPCGRDAGKSTSQSKCLWLFWWCCCILATIGTIVSYSGSRDHWGSCQGSLWLSREGQNEGFISSTYSNSSYADQVKVVIEAQVAWQTSNSRWVCFGASFFSAIDARHRPRLNAVALRSRGAEPYQSKEWSEQGGSKVHNPSSCFHDYCNEHPQCLNVDGRMVYWSYIHSDYVTLCRFGMNSKDQSSNHEDMYAIHTIHEEDCFDFDDFRCAPVPLCLDASLAGVVRPASRAVKPVEISSSLFPSMGGSADASASVQASEYHQEVHTGTPAKLSKILPGSGGPLQASKYHQGFRRGLWAIHSL